MGKLVRDRIPAIIAASGRPVEIRVLDQDEYRQELLNKLVEEAQEARTAGSSNLMEELADVWEVLLATASANGYSLRHVQEVAAQKRTDKGAFEQRLYLTM